ncbi:UDP-N-acetylmuramate--L-alanyl-gamma-D-glutamyl-meso-2,6-diaminoheptandioate ligase [Zhongshania aliphaticivorans]|uniref:UDP-N-acetylmuramate--L-alanyl-gamma-D-glutamyl-meso-2,6-diaminoheptandioate ligase n=1 Tax=Zhongshania aliphaticivorans TaxID=1470434 RepID=A0A5S9NVF3_9GAMM|nr:UDP-N-acetylmuramate:L-alanyl-gamma-D-glutamyl-meso-diaminopimelate ligase [Zhongshania aliphaticivorans]CAA0094697.1 UDP-N-acetylmuramate--L-alanyl-gamma-D-glutamyl-meso-2,6-diaminoheptandioate ligase [Zhongshania aliphaticivorans]CAA0112636.1 UDP-N-acetylmuramate--L-alanyl-gamma-D-glutamyl-meso-2,6-diaminoheptandioate ligase [Zhongshania aliphaticivorans]
MHLHILGICGTFMGGLAILARELGHTVTGSDANVYPPMSTQLESQGITLMEGYDPAHLSPEPDLVVIGNAMSRGNPAVEHVLNRGIPYTSGPQWLSDHVLQSRWVLACAGTHGKTTTSSMLAWVLEDCGFQPGFLIGGVPGDFGLSARLGQSDFFVIEADEYDSAFFDKRSKFVHYRPYTAILNNLEFDHADIFDDLAAIQRQFHHLVRTVPAIGRIVVPAAAPALNEVLEMGCWSEVERVSSHQGQVAEWQAEVQSDDYSVFNVFYRGVLQGQVNWDHTGEHNVNNALAALAAAHHIGVQAKDGITALCQFRGVKRRMELLATVAGIAVYDDFAHHPTAIETTLKGLRGRVEGGRIVALIEPRSNTMRMGVYKDRLAPATACADEVIWYQPPGLDWSLDSVISQSQVPARLSTDLDASIRELVLSLKEGDRLVIMSNGGFGGVHQRLLRALRTRWERGE